MPNIQVTSSDGTLDKYIGDSLMAVFGAPMEKRDDPERDILAGLEMKRELTAIMKETEPERKFDIKRKFKTKKLGPKKVKGITAEIMVYEVLS